MFLKVRENSKYYLTAIYTDAKGGFTADIETTGGKSFKVDYSNITNKFYKNGNNAKLAKYLCKACLDIACSKGICFLSEIERENALRELGNV